MKNPLAAHPPWRQLTIIAVLLPLMIVLAVLAFAWPAARIAPRGLPVGIVGTGQAGLLPAPVGTIGQWLPPGAGANLLRSTAYFNGHGASGHLTVLIIWIVLGLAAVAAGHHAPVRFAARRAWKRSPAAAPSAGHRAAATGPGAV